MAAGAANTSLTLVQLNLDMLQHAVFPIPDPPDAFAYVNAVCAAIVLCQTLLSVLCLRTAHLAVAFIHHPLTLWLAYALPPVLLIGWALRLLPFEPSGCWVYGLGVLFIGLPLMLGAFSMATWYRRSWSVSGAIIAGLTLALAFPLMLQLALVVQRPHCAAKTEQRGRLYTSLTAFAMAANTLPMITIVYLNLGSGGCVAMRQRISSNAKRALVLLGLRRSHRPRLQSCILYAISIGCLGVYSLLMQWQHLDNGVPTITRWAGYLFSLALIFVDGVVYLAARARLVTSPVVPLCLMLALRTALVVISVSGEAYLPLVHSATFVVIGCWVGAEVMRQRLRGAHAIDNLEHTARRAAQARRTHAVQPSAPLDDVKPRDSRLSAAAARLSVALTPPPQPHADAAAAADESLCSRLSRLPEVPVVFLGVAVAADVVYYVQLRQTRPERHPDIPWVDGSSIAQYVYILGAGLSALFFTLFYAVYLRLAACGWQLKAVALHACLIELVSCGFGILVYHLAGAWTTLTVLTFAPVALLFGMHGAARWSMHWTVLDATTLADLSVVVGCILGSGAMIFVRGHRLSAVIVGVAPLILLTSIAPLVKYLCRFHFDRFCYLSLSLSLSLLAAPLLIYHFAFGGIQMGVALAVAIYPVALLCGFSLLVWRNELWQLSRTVSVLLLLSAGTTFVFALVVTLVVSKDGGLALLAVWGSLVGVAIASVVWMRLRTKEATDGGQGRPVLLSSLIAAVLAGLFCAAPVYSVGMLMYTAFSLLVAVFLIAYGLSETASGYYIRSELLVPCWRYDAQHDEVRLSNNSVFATSGGFVIMLLWGCATTYTEQMTLGVTTSGMVVSLLYMYLNHGLQWDQLNLQALCHDVTPMMAVQAAMAASGRVAQRSVHGRMQIEIRRGDRLRGFSSGKGWVGTSGRRTAKVSAEGEQLGQSLSEASENFRLLRSERAANRVKRLALNLNGKLGFLLEQHGSDQHQFGQPARELIDDILLEVKNARDQASDPAALRAQVPATATYGPLVNQLAAWLPLITPTRPERKVEELRHAVTYECASLVAEVLLLLQMIAHLETANQEEALFTVLKATHARPPTSSARIQTWSRLQLAMVHGMRAMLLDPLMPFSSSDSSSKMPGGGRGLLKRLGSVGHLRGSTGHASDLSRLPRPCSFGVGRQRGLTFADAPPPSAREFVDSVFTPAAAVAGMRDDPMTPELSPSALHWRRASQLFLPAAFDARALPLLPSERSRIHAAGVLVGPDIPALGGWSPLDDALQECPFAAALRLILEHEVGSHAWLDRVLLSELVSAEGMYRFSLYSTEQASWQPVQIDDLLPCSELSGGLVPWHVRSSSQGEPRHTEMWLPLLHKAAAKFVGSYAALSSLSVPHILQMLTGGLLQEVPLPQLSSAASLEMLQLWLQAGCLVLLQPRTAPDGRFSRQPSGLVALDIESGAEMGREEGVARRGRSISGGRDRVVSAPRVSAQRLESRMSVDMWGSKAPLQWHAVRRLAAAGEAGAELHVWSVADGASGKPRAASISHDRATFGASAQHGGVPLLLSELQEGFCALHVVRWSHAWPATSLRPLLDGSRRAGACKCEYELRFSTAPEGEAAAAAVPGGLEWCGMLLSLYVYRGEPRAPPEEEADASVRLAVVLLDEAGAEMQRLLPGVLREDGSLDASLSLASLRTAAFLDIPAGQAAGQAPHSLVVSVSAEGLGAEVQLSMLLHAPYHLLVSQHWTGEQKAVAALHMQRVLLRFSARGKEKKLRKARVRREKCVEELLDVHSRFDSQLDVLANLWRQRIAELTHVGSHTSGNSIVNSIFPSLDAIISMSKSFNQALSGCSLGKHPFRSLQDANRKAVEQIVILCLKHSRRAAWRAAIARKEPFRLQLSVRDYHSRGADVAASLRAELAAAISAPADAIGRLEAKPAGAALLVTFEFARSTPHVHARRVEALAALVDRAAHPLPPAAPLAARVAGGLVRLPPSGGAVAIPAITAATAVSEIELGGGGWRHVLRWLVAGSGGAAKALAAAEAALAATPQLTVGKLVEAVHGAARKSIGEVFLMYAETFKVFQEYCNNIEAAGHRVAALNKIDAFKRAFLECQAKPEAKGSDIMNWISRPNQHLMRQPLILDTLTQLTPREHPDRAGLDAALAKLQAIVAQVDSRKLLHEQRMKLVQLQQQLRGDFGDFVLPHRQLLREGALLDVTASRGRNEHEAADEGLCSVLSCSSGSSCYAFLTNDSLWHCELLSDNRYRVRHVFHFEASGPAAARRGAARGSAERTDASMSAAAADLSKVKLCTSAAASSARKSRSLDDTIDVQLTGTITFRLSDGHYTVFLQPVSASEADATEWVKAIQKAAEMTTRSAKSTNMTRAHKALSISRPAGSAEPSGKSDGAPPLISAKV